jgi:hypothetical protein
MFAPWDLSDSNNYHFKQKPLNIQCMMRPENTEWTRISRTCQRTPLDPSPNTFIRSAIWQLFIMSSATTTTKKHEIR